MYTGERKAERSAGHIKGIWHGLGGEVGTRKIGLRRIEVAPEHFSTPAHEHGEEEETFFVLGGSGLLWQDGRRTRWAAMTASCIVRNVALTRCALAWMAWTCWRLVSAWMRR